MFAQTHFGTNTGLLITSSEAPRLNMAAWWKACGRGCEPACVRWPLRRWCSESPLHLAVEVSQVVLSVIEALCPDAQCDGCSVLHLASVGVEDLSSAHQLPRTESRHDAKAEALRKRETSGPTSIRTNS